MMSPHNVRLHVFYTIMFNALQVEYMSTHSTPMALEAILPHVEHSKVSLYT